MKEWISKRKARFDGYAEGLKTVDMAPLEVTAKRNVPSSSPYPQNTEDYV